MLKNLILTTLIIFSVSSLTAQEFEKPDENKEEAAQTEEAEDLIVGTWVAEGASFQDRVEFKQNGAYIEYSENGTKNYMWQIYTETSESGLIISTLRTEGAENNFGYEINSLSENRMVLVYMNGGHLSRIPYERQ